MLIGLIGLVGLVGSRRSGGFAILTSRSGGFAIRPEKDAGHLDHLPSPINPKTLITLRPYNPRTKMVYGKGKGM